MSIAVNAWNVPIDADIYRTLVKDDMAKCDVIFGPLYSKQVKPLSFFVKDNNIKLVIPFSITGNDVDTNPNIFQVYQDPETFFGDVINQFAYRFKDYNIVVIDCNDKTSDKGVFTFSLRKRLEEKAYRATSPTSTPVAPALPARSAQSSPTWWCSTRAARPSLTL